MKPTPLKYNFEYLKKFILEHPHKEVSIYELDTYIENRVSFDRIKFIYYKAGKNRINDWISIEVLMFPRIDDCFYEKIYQTTFSKQLNKEVLSAVINTSLKFHLAYEILDAYEEHNQLNQELPQAPEPKKVSKI